MRIRDWLVKQLFLLWHSSTKIYKANWKSIAMHTQHVKNLRQYFFENDNSK